MPTVVTWDSGFQLRSLQPAFVDADGLDSPQSPAAAASFVIRVDDVVLLTLMPDPVTAGSKIRIELGTNAIGAPFVAEPGELSVNLSTAPFVLPCQGVNYVRVRNEEAAARNFQFMLQKV